MTPARALRLFPAVVATVSAVAPALAQPSALDGAMDTSTPAAPQMTLEVQNVSPPPPDKVPDIDPIALYGGDIVFDVYRKGSKIGEHRTRFTRRGDTLTVISRMSLAVDVLFFTAYSFEYDSTEIWRNGEVVAVNVNTDDNGKISSVEARNEDGLFKVTGPKGTFIASSWVFPTNHWHRGQAMSKTILNTLNGRFNQIEVVQRGIETVQTAQGSIAAEHLEYTGQLRDTEVWYDAQNRWVKMRFKARDGSFIEYRCRQCGLAPGEGSAVAGEDAPAQTAAEPG